MGTPQYASGLKWAQVDSSGQLSTLSTPPLGTTYHLTTTPPAILSLPPIMNVSASSASADMVTSPGSSWRGACLRLWPTLLSPSTREIHPCLVRGRGPAARPPSRVTECDPGTKHVPKKTLPFRFRAPRPHVTDCLLPTVAAGERTDERTRPTPLDGCGALSSV